MKTPLDIMAVLVEADLMHRGIDSLDIENSVPTAEKLLAAKSARHCTDIFTELLESLAPSLDNGEEKDNTVDFTETIDSGERFYGAATALNLLEK